MTSIAWLDTVGDLSQVGGKAANLGELIRAGFDVPPGFVLTTEAYRRRGPGGELPPDLAAEVVEAYHALVGDTGAGVAVRSSATAEDLAEASFAGQQETFLAVVGEDALLEAVRGCWASLHSERAVAYRREHGVEELGLGMGVVVQLMIPAESAGVMFTANPTNGHTDQVVITASWGLGESVVAGLVDPDTLVVDTVAQQVLRRDTGDKATRIVATQQGTRIEQLPDDAWAADVLDDAQALELAALGRRIEAHFGAPQDIEWARDAQGFHVLQARPITALPERVDEVPDEWQVTPRSMYFRASIVEQMPSPLTPLFADLVAVAVPESLRALMIELTQGFGTGDPEAVAGLDMDFPTINGYAFYRYSNQAMLTYTRVSLPALRHLYSRGGETFIERWRDGALPAYRAVVEEWSRKDSHRLSSAELLAGVEALLLAGCVYYTHVQTIIPLAGTAELAWNALHKTLIGGHRVSAEQYLLGFDSTPVQAEKSLWDLGQWVRAHADLAAALADPDVDPRGPVPGGVGDKLWAQWGDRFRQHLAEYGHTVYDLDFVHPTPADDPGPILQALRFIVEDRGVDPYARQEAMAERRERVTAALLDSLDPLRRKTARATLRWAQRIVPVREDALAAMGLAWPLMRRLLGELGRRLVASGTLSLPDDVYWLTRDELAAAAAGEPLDAATLAGRIADRKALRRGQELLRPPQYLPRNPAMSLWDRFLPARQDEGTGSVLRGNAGSGGVVTGRARVIGGPADFEGFEPGEVLVAEITTPAYTPLFAVAGGIVTDVGGVLSHGSIVAREYGIPAVLGTGSATTRISTGDSVTVDGDRGEVRLDGAEASSPGPRWLPFVAAGTAAAAAVWWVRRRRR